MTGEGLTHDEQRSSAERQRLDKKFNDNIAESGRDLKNKTQNLVDWLIDFTDVLANTPRETSARQHLEELIKGNGETILSTYREFFNNPQTQIDPDFVEIGDKLNRGLYGRNEKLGRRLIELL